MQLMSSPAVTKYLPVCRIPFKEDNPTDFTDFELRNMVMQHVTGEKRYMITRFIGNVRAVDTSYSYTHLGVTQYIDIITADTILCIYTSKHEHMHRFVRHLFYHFLFSGLKVKKIGLIIPKQQQITVWNLERWAVSKKKDYVVAMFDIYCKYAFSEVQWYTYEKDLLPHIGATVYSINNTFDISRPWQVGANGYNIPKGYKVYMHSSCEINLGKPNAYKEHIEPLKKAVLHGHCGYVVHTGSNENQEVGVTALKANLEMLSKFATKKCPVLLENTAGQGSSLLVKLEDYVNMVLSLSKLNISACFDTCHVFSAGYCPVAALNYLLEIIDIRLIHFNDSVHPIGSTIDRHAAIGEGFVGSRLFEIAKLALKHKIDMVKEC